MNDGRRQTEGHRTDQPKPGTARSSVECIVQQHMRESRQRRSAGSGGGRAIDHMERLQVPLPSLPALPEEGAGSVATAPGSSRQVTLTLLRGDQHVAPRRDQHVAARRDQHVAARRDQHVAPRRDQHVNTEVTLSGGGGRPLVPPLQHPPPRLHRAVEVTPELIRQALRQLIQAGRRRALEPEPTVPPAPAPAAAPAAGGAAPCESAPPPPGSSQDPAELLSSWGLLMSGRRRNVDIYLGLPAARADAASDDERSILSAGPPLQSSSPESPPQPNCPPSNSSLTQPNSVARTTARPGQTAIPAGRSVRLPASRPATGGTERENSGSGGSAVPVVAAGKAAPAAKKVTISSARPGRRRSTRRASDVVTEVSRGGDPEAGAAAEEYPEPACVVTEPAAPRRQAVRAALRRPVLAQRAVAALSPRNGADPQPAVDIGDHDQAAAAAASASPTRRPNEVSAPSIVTPAPPVPSPPVSGDGPSESVTPPSQQTQPAATAADETATSSASPSSSGGGWAALRRCEPGQLLQLPDLRHALRPPSPAPEDAPGEDSEPHERQCWQIYQKLKSNGVSVSYDVIKRGMLTPTEYKRCARPGNSRSTEPPSAPLEAPMSCQEAPVSCQE